jgi:threonyl-tRNA synthetase
VLELQYNVKLCCGPAIDEGFYYDCESGDYKFSQDGYEHIEKCARKVISEKQEFQRLVLLKEDALRMFAYNPYKIELINSKIADGECVSVYRCGPFVDL